MVKDFKRYLINDVFFDTFVHCLEKVSQPRNKAAFSKIWNNVDDIITMFYEFSVGDVMKHPIYLKFPSALFNFMQLEPLTGLSLLHIITNAEQLHNVENV